MTPEDETFKDAPTASYRRMMALTMRNQGKTFKEVGEVFGVSSERARQLVTRATRECSAGYRYQHGNAGLKRHEIDALMPLLDFLRGVANENT